MKHVFRQIAGRVSTWAGSPAVFLGAVLVVAGWALSGKYFNYSDTWQLVINTGTTIVTFLMVFLIQNTQNRDGKAVQIKLDELLRATKGARQLYVGLEDMSDDEIAQLNEEFRQLAHRPGAARALQKLHETIEAEHAHRRGIHLPGRNNHDSNQL
ncbi:MAG TPA: low affinity iron permease family protein [Patescibacteria group bacterium]|jgi:low affinity Fe/Cu permease|nr:low affinity iron permease family protein [Patescibacteria group bacterium]